MRNKNILLLQAAYFPWVGGAEAFMKYTGEETARSNHVDAVTGLWSKPDVKTEKWNHSYENINDVHVHRVKTLSVPYIKTLSAIYPMYAKSLELLREKKYDLIHAHIYPAMVTAGIIKKQFPDIPLIITVQGGDLADYKENTGNFGFILRRLISFSLKNADLVHAVSGATAERAKALGAKNVKIIPNGVDRNRFFPLEDKKSLRREYGYGEEEKIIMTSSRLTPKNGIKELIEACADLKSREKNIRLVVIGGGEQEAEIKSFIAKNNYDFVDMLGYIDNSKLNEYYNVANVFCRPSLDEGFGISFIEAMAAGLPCVGTEVGGIPDIIEDGGNGLLVQPQEIKPLSLALERIISSQELERKLADAALEKIDRVYSWNHILKRINNTYDEILAGKPCV